MFNLVVSMEPLDAWLFFPKLVLFNTKRSRCEQDSNLRGKIPLDFKSNALTTRPSQLVQLSWVRYVQPRRSNVNHLKHCFLSTVDFFWHKKVSLRAGIEPAREDPIWFRGQRLYHSAITSDAIKLSALCSNSSFQWNHLTRGRVAFFPKLVLFNTKRSRCEQDSNLRWKIPLNFESNALTIRLSQLVQ